MTTFSYVDPTKSEPKARALNFIAQELKVMDVVLVTAPIQISDTDFIVYHVNKMNLDKSKGTWISLWFYSTAGGSGQVRKTKVKDGQSILKVASKMIASV